MDLANPPLRRTSFSITVFLHRLQPALPISAAEAPSAPVLPAAAVFLFDLDPDPGVLEGLHILNAALGQVDAEQSANEPGFEVLHFNVFRESEGSAPGADFTLREEKGWYHVAEEFGFHGFATRRPHDWTAIFSRFLGDIGQLGSL